MSADLPALYIMRYTDYHFPVGFLNRCFKDFDERRAGREEVPPMDEEPQD